MYGSSNGICPIKGKLIAGKGENAGHQHFLLL